LHNRLFCRTAISARVWWRIHYRHHSAPMDSAVILGAPWTLILAAVFGALLVVPLQASPASLASAGALSFGAAIAYEYFHSIDHSRVELRDGYLHRMRRHHLEHHYRNENCNFGIVTDVIDRLMAKHADSAPLRSPTVRNLGYVGELREQYPWIDAMEESAAAGGSPRAESA
jgi:sterol desaturase/sphingolipid hydroxylase (fatty acid hydroxylase superfamily)